MKQIFTLLLLLLPFSIFSRVNLHQGLVAPYPFNSNANEESGNENHGVVNGATLTEDRFGNANRAYFFNGSSNYISINSSPNLTRENGYSVRCVKD